MRGLHAADAFIARFGVGQRDCLTRLQGFPGSTSILISIAASAPAANGSADRQLTGQFGITPHVSCGPRQPGDDPVAVGRESRDHAARFAVTRDAVLPSFDKLCRNRPGEWSQISRGSH